MKQSSVDWLIERISDVDLTPSIWAYCIAKARQMHKEEIENAIELGIGLESGFVQHDFKQGSIIDVYYNNTFEK